MIWHATDDETPANRSTRARAELNFFSGLALIVLPTLALALLMAYRLW